VKTHRNSLKRRTPLRRSQASLKRRGISRQSRKRERLSEERRHFVSRYLLLHPYCQIGLCPEGTLSREVHEALRRSAGGEIVPGPKADAQGQKFWAICRDCHETVTNPTAIQQALAIQEGWVISRYARASN